jgi:hypothetical protein
MQTEECPSTEIIIISIIIMMGSWGPLGLIIIIVVIIISRRWWLWGLSIIRRWGRIRISFICCGWSCRSGHFVRDLSYMVMIVDLILHWRNSRRRCGCRLRCYFFIIPASRARGDFLLGMSINDDGGSTRVGCHFGMMMRLDHFYLSLGLSWKWIFMMMMMIVLVVIESEGF